MDIDELTKVFDLSTKQVSSIFTYLSAPHEEARAFLAKAAEKSEGITTHDIEAAAVKFHSRKLTHHFLNSSKIYAKAKTILAERLNFKEEGKVKIDLDWLDYFEEKSKTISNDVVQEIWARILASEIIRPNTISKKLIDVLSYIDIKTAQAFLNLCELSVFFYVKTGATSWSSNENPLILHSDDLFNMSGNFDLIQDFDYYKIHANYNYGMLTLEEVKAVKYGEYSLKVPTSGELQILEEIGLIKIADSYSYKQFNKIFDIGKTVLKNNYKVGCVEINSTFYDFVYIDDEKKVETKKINVGTVEFTKMGRILANHLEYEKFPELDAILSDYLKTQNIALSINEKDTEFRKKFPKEDNKFWV